MKQTLYLIAVATLALLLVSCKKDPASDQPISSDKTGIDLGLSVKWAACNVGATKPEEYGDYFAWGATSTQASYDWANAPFNGGNSNYNETAWNNAKSGAVDPNTSNLLLANDIAHVKWGGNWRMPTAEEWKELQTKCTWSDWITDYKGTGVAGYMVTSKTNGNSIFIPAAGYRKGTVLDDVGEYCGYWSSSVYPGDLSSALSLYSYSGYINVQDVDRLFGLSVRPVSK